jgi:signal recognition particle subunit SRP54
MDGDARGGAALSVREVSGAPIKFVGVGEKLGALEPFYPERMASRILGMGDVVTLVEKAQSAIAAKDAEEMQARLLAAQFDFNDFLKQAEMVSSMGSMSSLMRMMPGMRVSDRALEEAEKSFKVSQSLVRSMTPAERAKPELIAASASRRRRIARGAGRTDEEMAGLVELFAGMRAKMQDMSRLVKIAGGNVGQMTEEEMTSLVGVKKRVPKGMARRYKKVELRKVATAEEANELAAKEQAARAFVAAAAAAAAAKQPASVF